MILRVWNITIHIYFRRVLNNSFTRDNCMWATTNTKYKKRTLKHYCCDILCKYDQSEYRDSSDQRQFRYTCNCFEKCWYAIQTTCMGVPWFEIEKWNGQCVIRVVLRFERLSRVTLFLKIILFRESNWKTEKSSLKGIMTSRCVNVTSQICHDHDIMAYLCANLVLIDNLCSKYISLCYLCLFFR
jgi:hypothetical protein